ncbi:MULTISPECIES: 5'-3' exonuclease [unclassified Mycoplasma]|uniref:5'-3' exonuclease n=1 Tax=unclassified Mycoplasma TaxID=2683645 RepID=UPI00216B3630|nr:MULTISPECIES: 5'-3' exonuclease [unclassified Mycoplasma]MCS4536642.1 5'-3' exonuclease [Mycoplasma sp. CSL7475-4]MCT4469538.1 5'-3' exonuclease [Mycoplasma sp. HS2188]
MNNKKDKFLLIDGNFLLFQSFYASYSRYGSSMQDSQGRSTNGVHVFFMTLHKILNYIQPQYLFIAFDAHGKTKRHLLYEDYKAGRSKAPESIHEQFDYVKQILTGFNIKWFEQVGDEADDLIATLSQIENVEKYIFSKDQDLLQLVNESTSVIYKSSDNEFDLYTTSNFEQIHKIKPYQIPDLKGLAGDSSDNIKGVAGIGKIGAIKLINKYGSIENIYQNIHEIKGATKSKLELGVNDAKFAKSLTILNKNVEMNTDLPFYSVTTINVDEGINVLESFDLNYVITKWKEFM